MVHSNPWYADIANYLVTVMIPEVRNKHDRDRFLHCVKFYIWVDPYLFKYCYDQIVRRCVLDLEVMSILSFCHDQVCGGHFSGKTTAAKMSQCRFY